MVDKFFLVSFAMIFLLGFSCCKSTTDVIVVNENDIANDSLQQEVNMDTVDTVSEGPRTAPAYPGLIKYQQPDGTVISVFLKGDERIQWAETKDGYTILMNDNGEYQYAIHDDDGRLILSGVKVSPKNKRTEEELFLLQKTPENLFFSDEQILEMKQSFD